MQYSKAVTDYFESLPLKEQQTLMELIYWGIDGGLAKTVVQERMDLPGVPPMPYAVFDEIYEAMFKELAKDDRSKWDKPH